MRSWKPRAGVVTELLRQGLNRHQCRLERQRLASLESRFTTWATTEGLTFSEDDSRFHDEESSPAVEHLCTFLLRVLTAERTRLLAMRRWGPSFPTVSFSSRWPIFLPGGAQR